MSAWWGTKDLLSQFANIFQKSLRSGALRYGALSPLALKNKIKKNPASPPPHNAQTARKGSLHEPPTLSYFCILITPKWYTLKTISSFNPTGVQAQLRKGELVLPLILRDDRKGHFITFSSLSKHCLSPDRMVPNIRHHFIHWMIWCRIFDTIRVAKLHAAKSEICQKNCGSSLTLLARLSTVLNQNCG